MKFAERILSQAEKPYYTFIVFLMTVCESIFLFIPPEVFMTPAIIANKKRAVPIVLAATLGSIVGGAIAYMIGHMLYELLGSWLIYVFADPELIPDPHNIPAVKGLIQNFLDEWGFWMIAITAVTPIPYKVLAIALGLCDYGILRFLGISAIFRTGRFVIVGYLLWRFQDMANRIVKKYFWQVTIGTIVIAILGIGLICLI